MAAKKTTTATAAAERAGIALNACYEIEAMLSHLLTQIPKDDKCDDLVWKTLLRRAKQLNSVVMSVHGGEDDRETAEMYEVVTGEPMEVAHG